MWTGDWSSDVCSSDLAGSGGRAQDLSVLARVHGAVRAAFSVGGSADHRRVLRHDSGAYQADPFGSALAATTDQAARSEERRVGKEWGARGPTQQQRAD